MISSVPSYIHNKYRQIKSKDPLQNLWCITIILEHTLQPQHTTSNHITEIHKMSVSEATSVASAEDEEMSVTLGEVSGIDDGTGENASNGNNKETEEDMFFGQPGKS